MTVLCDISSSVRFLPRRQLRMHRSSIWPATTAITFVTMQFIKFTWRLLLACVTITSVFVATAMATRPGEGEYEPLADRPLFGNGEARPRERMVNAVIMIVTILLVFFTAISAFVSGSAGLDLFFVVCIILFCISHLTLIVWYRHGDLDPKFKKLIYFNTFCIILTCICGNIFFHT